MTTKRPYTFASEVEFIDALREFLGLSPLNEHTDLMRAQKTLATKRTKLAQSQA